MSRYLFPITLSVALALSACGSSSSGDVVATNSAGASGTGGASGEGGESAASGSAGIAGQTAASGNAGASTTINHVTFRPPIGTVLLIAGQNQDGLGGLPGLDGYLDHVTPNPGGYTYYVGLPDPPAATIPGLEDGVGLYTSIPALQGSVLHLSVPWVRDSSLDTTGGADEAAQEAEQQAVLSGAQDPAIDHLAMWCASQPRPILLRLGYEFDRQNYYDQKLYIPAYQHIVDRFRLANVTNVNFVWASSNLGGPTDFDSYYPGDDYVDWMGFSMWNAGKPDKVILTQARARQKPVLLAETTPLGWDIAQGLDTPPLTSKGKSVTPDQIWAGWYAPMIAFINANSDVVAGFHYISEDWHADPQWSSNILFSACDSRPYGNDAFLSMWTAAISAPPFLNASNNTFAMLGWTGQLVI